MTDGKHTPSPKPTIDVLLVEIGCTCCAAMSAGRGSTEAGFLAGAVAGAVAGAGGRLSLCARHLTMWRSGVSLIGIREVDSWQPGKNPAPRLLREMGASAVNVGGEPHDGTTCPSGCPGPHKLVIR